MTFAALAAGIAGSAAASGIGAAAGKGGAEDAANANVAGLGDASNLIREAIQQYAPYRRGGDRAYKQQQKFYGFEPEGMRARKLSTGETRQLSKLRKLRDSGGQLNEQQTRKLSELAKLDKARNQWDKYRSSPDFNYANRVGRPEERQLEQLTEEFNPIERGIYAQQEEAQRAYEARTAGLDQEYRGVSTSLDDAYYAEERALRDKIARGDITVDPGYKFRLEQGQMARERGAAARGGLLSGGHMKDLEDFSQGLASQEFQAGTNRLYDLYGLGAGNFGMRRGNLTGDYERSRGYAGDDYSRLGGYLDNRLGNERDTFARRYGATSDQRGFDLDRFSRRMGGVGSINQQGFNALQQQGGLSQILAQLAAGQGQARAQGIQGQTQAGQGLYDDMGFLSLLGGLSASNAYGGAGAGNKNQVQGNPAI